MIAVLPGSRHVPQFEELTLLCVRQLGPEAHGAGVQRALAEQGGREVTLGAI